MYIYEQDVKDVKIGQRVILETINCTVVMGTVVLNEPETLHIEREAGVVVFSWDRIESVHVIETEFDLFLTEIGLEKYELFGPLDTYGLEIRNKQR